MKKGNNWAFIKENEKWGYIDKNGNMAIPPKWKTVTSFSEDLAFVQDFDDKWGCIDKKGNIVIPCKYNTEIEVSLRVKMRTLIKKNKK